MKPIVKRVLVGGLGVVVALAAAGGIFVFVNVSATDASLDKQYDIPVPSVTHSTDPVVIARGKHIAESFAGCAGSDCHGADLGGGTTLAMGPIGEFTGPNLTSGGLGAVYSDGEFARLIRHGVKKDGRTARFMPVQDSSWMPESDRVALISYLRAVPKVDRPNGVVRVGVLAKVLDRRDGFALDIARRIDHGADDVVPAPEPTAAYGKFVARSCTGCHGLRLSGGRIPGAPASFPMPLNLTPDETGLKGWTYEDFDKLASTGMRKNGKEVDPFMPRELMANLDETEKRATFAYLATLAPAPLGGR